MRASRRKMIGSVPRSGVGAALVAGLVLVCFSSTALGGTTVSAHPPYRGAVFQSTVAAQSGCAYVKVNQAWNFNLTSGKGGGWATGKAPACKHTLFGFGGSSTVNVNGQTEVALTFKPPANTTHIQANVTAAWSLAVKSSDGGHPACTQGSSYDQTSYYAQWGFVNSRSGGYFAEVNQSRWDRSTTTSGFASATSWSNWTYAGPGVYPVPHPWHFNGTSSFSWNHYWGGQTTCYSGAEVQASAYATLYDESNATTIYNYNGGSTIGGYSGGLFDAYVYTQNGSYWSCSNSTSWDGPRGSWSNSSQSCSVYNSTIISHWGQFCSGCRAGSSSNNSVVLQNTSSVSGAWWWNYTFNHKDRYAMFIWITGTANAQNSWPIGNGAAFLLNMATLGNGVRITSIEFG
ncbi:MAG TPA: hypothetical protein VFF67_01630 [Thermoplasmata archaeon]|nr:hypothetical protein [Thermoplasmata archaeon]